MTEFQQFTQPPEHALGRPQNLDSEQLVIGSILKSAEIYELVESILTERDFVRDWHRYLWSGIVEIRRAGATPTVDSLVHLLKRDDPTTEWGMTTEQYVNHLAGMVCAPSNAVFYARFVADDAVRRRLCEVAPLISVASNDYRLTVEEVRSRVSSLTASAMESIEDESQSAHMSEYAEEVIGGIIREVDGEARQRGADTGLSSLDYLLGGMVDDIVLLAARTSVGKSALALRVCETFCRRGDRVMYFSLEMDRKSLVERMTSMLTRVPSTQLKNRAVTDQQRASLIYAKAEMRTWDLLIDEKAGVTPEYIRSKCKSFARKKSLDLIVIDHLHIMEDAVKSENDVKNLGDRTKAIHNIAREFKCPVLLLCQLNRGPENRPDSVPAMRDIRASGSIEENSDTIIAIHRPDMKKAIEGDCEEASLHILKNRGGPAGGFVKIAFKADCVRFDNSPEEARGVARGTVQAWENEDPFAAETPAQSSMEGL